MVDLKVVYKGKVLLFFWCGLLALHYTRNSGCANTQGTHTHTQLQVTKVKVKLKQENDLGVLVLYRWAGALMCGCVHGCVHVCVCVHCSEWTFPRAL